MLIKKETFDKLCPSYQNVIRKLEEKYAAIPEENYIERTKILKEYFHQYLMLPEILDKYLDLLNDYQWSYTTDEECCNFLSTVLNEKRYASRILPYHLNEHKAPHAVTKKLLHKKPKHHFHDSLDKPFTLKQIEAEVICPQTRMDKTWRFYEEYSRDPIPKNIVEKYQKAQELYEKIVKAENDQVKWFNLLTECENDDYVYANIDARLGKNFNNLELWNLYFKYLKNHSPKRLLHLYSRYCRYFLDDFKMKEEYKNATKRYGPIKVFWTNAFDFEIYEKNIDLILSEFGNLNLNDFKSSCQNESIDIPFTKPSFNTYKIQNFSFPKTIMVHIIEKRSPNVLRNLQKSCKYFFILQPFAVCHKFLLKMEEDDVIFNGHSLQVPIRYSDELNDIFNHKIILSNSYHVYTDLFLSKIHECNAKYIRISSIKLDITWRELIFLVGHGNVEVMEMMHVNILNAENTPVAFEEILRLLPKIIELKIMVPQLYTTSQTFETLQNLKFVNKIQLLDLRYLTYLEPYGFSEFLKINLDSNAEVLARFQQNLYENEAAALQKEVENKLHDYWPDIQKPLIQILCQY